MRIIIFQVATPFGSRRREGRDFNGGKERRGNIF
jgi:hypothetical protein